MRVTEQQDRRTHAKHGLRCGACKMSIHHKCADGLAPQRCMGKLTSELVEVPEEADGSGDGSDLRTRSNSVFTYPENGTDDFGDQAKTINHQGPPSKDPLQMNTYVALYRFVPQENEDLEMR
ncbi:hypothetical protein U0070_021675 [Myodes glareolus]|uniref:Phorbol-ester/DAG-type domain-containing protein n=1 Tax=Myodes glareolus TaxID=447135 RepID=A0AAW0IQX9_MYOGA